MYKKNKRKRAIKNIDIFVRNFPFDRNIILLLL